MSRAIDQSSEEPLLVSGPFSYYRTKKDKPWVAIFATIWAACLFGSIYFWTNRNPVYLELSQDYLNDPSHCPLNQNPSGQRRSLLGHHHNDKEGFELGDFWAHAAWWLVISILSSVLVGVFFLLAIRHHAFSLARATIAFQIFVPLFAALTLTFNGQVNASLGLWFLTAVSAFVFYLWRNEIATATQLLSVAGHGLAANNALIGLPIILNVISLFSIIPLGVCAAIGLSNGDVVPNPARQGSQTCTDAAGDKVLCCTWQPDQAAMGYLALLGLTAAWTTFTLYQIRVWIVSGTVSQWYFSAVDTPTKGNFKRSVGHAVGPGLGTNIFAGLVMAFTQSVKQDAQNAQQRGDFSIFGFIASLFASVLEYLTKFAVVFASITGDSLIEAGKRSTDLLSRNMLNAVAVTIWFPNALLTLASFTLSFVWGTAIGTTYGWLHSAGSKELHPAANAAVLGVVVGISTFVVLQFLVGVLLSVLDAVFVCWALDRDRAVVSLAEVHDVFGKVAYEKGVALEQQTAQVA